MFQIIPAIDLIEGQCVRLTQGDYAQKKVYSSDPLEVAKAFEGAGIKRLHLVDLDGAKAKKIVNIHVLERIAQGTSLHIDFGGGVQSDEMIDLAFSAGASQITAGSIAVKNPALVIGWFQQYEKIQAKNPSLHIIASGGVASMDDLNQLKEMNLFGVIVGKAFYEGRITLDELASFSNNTLC